MPAHTSPLTDETLTIVFASAPAGLGHLRVTNSLYRGLPPEAEPILLSHAGEMIRWLHRLTSTNPLGKKLFEWGQHGKAEDFFTRLYRKALRTHTNGLEKELRFVLSQRLAHPKTLVVIATHFGLAHQLAAIKHHFEKANDVRVKLIVQVTDDSPQHIWYVPGADLTIVPSQRTADELMIYGASTKLKPTEFLVLPYPINPELGTRCTPQQREHREAQLAPKGRTPVQIVFPVSGAAVGLMFIEEMTRKLRKLTRSSLFHIVVKRTPYTQFFVTQMSRRFGVHVFSSSSDREIVNLYDQLYEQTTVALEVTKPSEQAFKTLFTPQQRGGVILLFTNPVGRQEYDNLSFLEKHRLLPSKDEQHVLWEWAKNDLSLKSAQGARLLREAQHWRSLRLPSSATEAAHFLWWAKEQGLFAAMLDWKSATIFPDELGSDGVEKFWQACSELLHKR